MQNFGSNIDLRKVDFLSQEKISDLSRILTNVNNEDIFNVWKTRMSSHQIS